MIRCTLKGFERSSQIRISSNQINKIRLYSTVSGYEVKAQRELDLLNPYFVTGFTDALLKKVAGINQFSTTSPREVVPPLAAGTKRSCSNNLSLVVWGTNLTSTVGMGRITKQESNMIRFPYYQKSVIIGLLLSDG